MNREKASIVIQAWYRGWYYRSRNLPNALRYVKFLIERSEQFSCYTKHYDGRVNSSMDETNLLNILHALPEIKERVKNIKTRGWSDVLIRDFRYGWLPVNIKSSMTTTADNIGNLATCVYALTNYDMNLEKNYHNGIMSMMLVNAVENKHFNEKLKRDYYFLVINKENLDVIINSLRGVEEMTCNNYNLPFQIRWCKNKNFVYRPIKESVDMVIDTIKKGPELWVESFLRKIRNL
jgi:hypothetical protein